ncbi:MAG: ATP-binding protein [Gammaproteobacteria bacterium]|nr:ATP-binding protein [Gammaproteobacteria bacterium]MDD9961370.1 ATP-binding protein [Gammaproteobacteria bacterium]MDE0272757.1 ATP-binding protein [Gammaproteobacteria bacterium]
MLPDASNSPFQPGTGGIPPVLAGREREQATLMALLERLANDELKQTIHLLQASRGMGKTVLLRDLEKSAPLDVAVIYAPAAKLSSLDSTAQLIDPRRSWWRQTLSWFGSLTVAGVSIKRPAAAPAGEFQALDRALARCRKRPFLLVVDEAHTLAPDLTHMLLNVFQDLAGRQPCGLLLAGTPALEPFLLSDAVNASFVERAPIVIPGLLSAAQSREALDAPQWRDWQLDEAVLDEAVAESLGYPYFLQLWGKALWEQGCARKTLDNAVLEAARPPVEAVRGRFYARRFDEFERDACQAGLDRNAMLKAAESVAAEVAAPGAVITTGQLNRLLDDAGLASGDAAAAKRIIVNNGFLMRTADEWRPAIPSLAAYIRDHPRLD